MVSALPQGCHVSLDPLMTPSSSPRPGWLASFLLPSMHPWPWSVLGCRVFISLVFRCGGPLYPMARPNRKHAQHTLAKLVSMASKIREGAGCGGGGLAVARRLTIAGAAGRRGDGKTNKGRGGGSGADCWGGILGDGSALFRQAAMLDVRDSERARRGRRGKGGGRRQRARVKQREAEAGVKQRSNKAAVRKVNVEIMCRWVWWCVETPSGWGFPRKHSERWQQWQSGRSGKAGGLRRGGEGRGEEGRGEDGGYYCGEFRLVDLACKQ